MKTHSTNTLRAVIDITATLSALTGTNVPSMRVRHRRTVEAMNTALTTALPAWLDRDAYPFSPRTFTTPEGAISYLDEGAGPVVVVVHGTPTWSFEWRNVIRELSSHPQTPPSSRRNARPTAPPHEATHARAAPPFRAARTRHSEALLRQAPPRRDAQ